MEGSDQEDMTEGEEEDEDLDYDDDSAVEESEAGSTIGDTEKGEAVLSVSTSTAQDSLPPPSVWLRSHFYVLSVYDANPLVPYRRYSRSRKRQRKRKIFVVKKLRSAFLTVSFAVRSLTMTHSERTDLSRLQASSERKGKFRLRSLSASHSY